MADPEHVAALKQGQDAFRVWRDQNRGTVPDLSGADFTGEDLTGVNLEPRAAVLPSPTFLYSIKKEGTPASLG
jgi:hypothetical protein